METYLNSRDIKVFYLYARSFPEGIGEAHADLRELLPSTEGRNFFGISYPVKNHGIVYKAAVEEAYEGEAERYGCETFVIRKGPFIAEKITDWEKKKETVGVVFQRLLAHPCLDRNGYCLEIYGEEEGTGDEGGDGQDKEGKQDKEGNQDMKGVKDMKEVKDMKCLVPLDPQVCIPGDAFPDRSAPNASFPGTVSVDCSEGLSAGIRDVFEELRNTVGAFEEGSFNKVPFEGSWTPGQICEHIIKFTSGLPDHHTQPAERPYDEKVEMLRQLFLNFSIRMQSPGFVQPGNGPQDRPETLKAFRDAQERLQSMVKAVDLSAICMDLELPVFGYLTRYEWMEFFVVHIQRHIRQLRNILVSINGSAFRSAGSVVS